MGFKRIFGPLEAKIYLSEIFKKIQKSIFLSNFRASKNHDDWLVLIVIVSTRRHLKLFHEGIASEALVFIF